MTSLFLMRTTRPKFFPIRVPTLTTIPLPPGSSTWARGLLIPEMMAIFFNLVNGFTNGYYFSAFSRVYTWEWLTDARFIIGAILYGGGTFLNWWSDQILLNLRKGGKKGYFIPEKGLFRWVSCPNFMGEIIQWTGFAVMTWSPAALVFALWTFYNLVPRALSHHRWYRKKFEDYPPERKAVIPYLL